MNTISRVQFLRGNWAREVTNTEEFCISCHKMKDYVYQEYKDTIHYNNRTGVRATCPECHVPDEEGQTCIECHRGIAHSLPALYEEDPSAVIGHREGS